MKLGESGEAFFVEEIEDTDNDDIPEHLATSPIPVSDFENLYTSQVIFKLILYISTKVLLLSVTISSDFANLIVHIYLRTP